MKRYIIVFYIWQVLFALYQVKAEKLKYGPDVKATVGKIWPKPYRHNYKGTYYVVNPNDFKFVVINNDCAILQHAIKRYTKIIKASAIGYHQAPGRPTLYYLENLSVNLTQPCETLPHLGMDESYHIWGDGCILSKSVWGILRGLETLSQLLVPLSNGMLYLSESEIFDSPRFKYRGLMLDTARHFINKSKILQIIEGMSFNKLNVFHWHMTDDSSFPYKSKVFPELAQLGAYHPGMTYSMEDIAEIVEFARLRGIRVVPEFDTPSHTASWYASHPELMTNCSNAFYERVGPPFNPTLDVTYNFLYKLFTEIKTLFPDQYLHLGVDEVNTMCWESSYQIESYLTQHKIDKHDIMHTYLKRFSANITALGWKQMVWQDPLKGSLKMNWPNGTIAQVCHNSKYEMSTLADRGFDIVMSDGWYLSRTEMGSDWEKFYRIEPTDFHGSKEQKKHVIGGEACLWSEWINEHSVIPAIFPRVSAIAERLWSEKVHRDIEEARKRLEEHNCRMIFRGIEARAANSFGLC